jgi:hypothetical protein
MRRGGAARVRLLAQLQDQQLLPLRRLSADSNPACVQRAWQSLQCVAAALLWRWGLRRIGQLRDTNTEQHADGYEHADNYADRDTDEYTNADSDSDAHSNGHAYGHTGVQSQHPDAHPNINHHPDLHRHADLHRNPAAHAWSRLLPRRWSELQQSRERRVLRRRGLLCKPDLPQLRVRRGCVCDVHANPASDAAPRPSLLLRYDLLRRLCAGQCSGDVPGWRDYDRPDVHRQCVLPVHADDHADGNHYTHCDDHPNADADAHVHFWSISYPDDHQHTDSRSVRCSGNERQSRRLYPWRRGMRERNGGPDGAPVLGRRYSTHSTIRQCDRDHPLRWPNRERSAWRGTDNELRARLPEREECGPGALGTNLPT